MNEKAIHLRLQLAAALQDCIKSMEDTPEEYMWGEDRSQMYVDVADMALAVAEAWENIGVSGIIYEVSEAIITACESIPGPLDAAQIKTIVQKTWDADQQAITHTKDSDCTLGPDGCCTVCGACHTFACENCGGRGYHLLNCKEID